jgi:hypothetical protein
MAMIRFTRFAPSHFKGSPVNRKIKIPGTLSAARKGPVKASPEVHERRGERRKGPFRVERKGFAWILSRQGPRWEFSGARFRAGECGEEGSIRIDRVLYIGVHVRDVVDGLRRREGGR